MSTFWSQTVPPEEVTEIYDSRITVRYGTGPEWWNIHGHLYTVDQGRNKYRSMHPDERRYPRGGRSPAYWAWDSYPSHEIPPGTQEGVDDVGANY